ncbi:hypothetical protein PIROE2DRAFT_6083 [Piromyces sp. E2]|nr:hypothetical protein PIROE2DRAFT_6083 [Piromyces sp. E2]|eukprot:OUM66663.1 hypothetical protein PIROE2DRAFT_6083 [Piromyces sp. E2]
MYIKNSQSSTNILEKFPRKNERNKKEKNKKEKEKEESKILERLFEYKDEEKLPYCFVIQGYVSCFVDEYYFPEGVDPVEYNKHYRKLLKNYTPPDYPYNRIKTESDNVHKNEPKLEPEPGFEDEPEPGFEDEPNPGFEDEPNPEYEHYKDNKNKNKYNNNTKPKNESTDLKWDSIPQNNGSNNSTAKTIDHLNKYNDHGNNNISHTGTIDNSNNIKKESSSFIKFNSVTISIIALIVIGSTLFAYRKRIHSMIIKNKYKNKNENDLKLLTIYTDFDDDGINKQNIFSDVGYISKQNQNISTNSINNITTTTNNNNNYNYDYDYNYNDNNKIEISQKDSVKSPKLAVLTNSNFSLNRSLSRGRKQDISLKGTFSRGIKQDSNIKRTLSRCKKQNIDIRISTMTDKEDIDMIRDYIRSSSPTRSPTRSLNRSPTKSPTLSINRSPIMSPKMSYSLPRMNNHISDLTNTLPRVNNKQEYTSNSNDYNEEKYNFSLDYISSLRKFDLDVIKQDSNIKRTLSRYKEDIDMIRDYIRSSSPTRSPTRSLNRSPTKSPTLSINRSPIMSPKMSYSLPRMNNHISDLTNTLPRVNNKQEYTSNSNDYNEEKYNFSLDYISSLRKFDLDVNNFNNNTLQRNMVTQDVDSSTIYSKYTDKSDALLLK